MMCLVQRGPLRRGTVGQPVIVLVPVKDEPVDAAPRRYAPVVTLFLLSPFVGEVLFGAVPLSRLPFGLLGLVGLYGGGAVLVRELARSRRLGDSWTVLLGLAYGILEEGPVVQSLFDRHFRGLDFLGFYGHWAGVSWVWALFIVPYHAMFSIAIPILLTDLIFDERRDDRWLGPSGVLVVLAIFLANALLLAVLHTGLFTARAPVTSIAANAAALLIVAAIVAAAFKAKPGPPPPAGRAPVRPWRLRLAALAAGLAWFVGFRVIVIGTGTLMSAPLALACGAAIALAIALAMRSLAPPRGLRSAADTYAIVAGALPTCWLMGFLIAAVSGGNPVVKLAGHAVFGGLMFAGLRRLRRRAAA
jgi:hypothetical protein